MQTWREANLLNKPSLWMHHQSIPPLGETCLPTFFERRKNARNFIRHTNGNILPFSLQLLSHGKEAAFANVTLRAGFKSSFHERLLKGANEDYSARPGGTQCNGN
jgi:hypothetical protein